MRGTVRNGLVAAMVAGLVLAGCGSSGGSDAASDGGGGDASASTTAASDGGGCEVVTLDQVKEAFPDEGFDKEEKIEVAGSSDACEFTGDVKAGVMGKYTGPTTITMQVGTYDEAGTGEASYAEVSGQIGADVQTIDGFDVAAGGQKAVAKFSDGTYAFATIDSPELSGPGNDQTVAMLELVAANQ